MYTKILRRVCCTEVSYDIDGHILKNVKFKMPEGKGCKPGMTCFEMLIEGKRVEEVIKNLITIECRQMGTSCYKQFAQALKKQLEQE